MIDTKASKGVSKASRPNAFARLGVHFATGYSAGLYNVGPYSKRGAAYELAAHIVQRTEGVATVDGHVFGLRAYIYQRTTGKANVAHTTNKNFSFAIIQSTPFFAKWEALPPFRLQPSIVQRFTFSPGVTLYVGNVYLAAKVVQRTPFKAKATFIRDLHAAGSQSTTVRVNAYRYHVQDMAAHVVQRTVFVPGVNVNWSRWVPFNNDYPAPWNTAREAA